MCCVKIAVSHDRNGAILLTDFWTRPDLCGVCCCDMCVVTKKQRATRAFNKNSVEEDNVICRTCATLTRERKISWSNCALEIRLGESLLNIWSALPGYAVWPCKLLLVACLVQFCCVA